MIVRKRGFIFGRQEGRTIDHKEDEDARIRWQEDEAAYSAEALRGVRVPLIGGGAMRKAVQYDDE